MTTYAPTFKNGKNTLRSRLHPEHADVVLVRVTAGSGDVTTRLALSEARAFARWLLAVTEPKRSKKTGERGR